jgi:D-3-phosphoglycerate dehydrogenase
MNETRPRVLVADAISEAGIEVMAGQLDVEVRTGLPEDVLIEVIPDFEAIVVRSATRVTAGVIAAAGRLKVIARAGAGLDTIDVAAATEHGIKVVNSPDANTVAVAELTLGLMLSLARNIPKADAAMKEGRWEKSKLMGTGLSGKTLGIIGFGRIGQEVAARAKAFGMNVITNQRRPTPEMYRSAGVEPVDLMDLLARSDYVSLHLPAREDTVGLIGADELGLMKSSAFLINTSRGTVVDADALLGALDSGEIAGAGLDVFAREPAVDDPLASHPRVIATPHIGASTEDAQTTAAIDVAHKILAELAPSDELPVLPLRFVAIEQVVPHETVDLKRAGRLGDRIAEEGVVRNPPLVARVDDRYVVLDGATRSSALRQMGYPHIVVQDVAVDGELLLETWHHVVRAIPVDELVAALNGVGGIRLEETAPEEAASRVIEYGGLCAVITVDGRGFVVHANPGLNRFDAVTAFSDTYIAAATVSRNLERNVRTLASWYPDMTALVEYPQFTVEQVLLAAGSGRLLPAGVTRFLIPGRVLRLDIPLEMLSAEQTLQEKNRWLAEYLAEKERKGKIRYYREPVYLLDE